MSDLVFGILLVFYIMRITPQPKRRPRKSDASEDREARIVPE